MSFSSLSLLPELVQALPQEIAKPTDIQALVEQLRSGDMEAEDTWRLLEPALRARDGRAAEEVATAIDELDYSTAADRLSSLLGTG